MIRKCAECGKPFNGVGNAKYCGVDCRLAAENRKTRERRAIVKERICPMCGKSFVSKRSIFCSRNCRDKWNSGKEKPDMRIVLSEEEAKKRKLQEEQIEKKRKTHGVIRTKTGAIWYPVSGAEIQRMAREQHKTYGEIAAMFLSEQVRGEGMDK